MEPLASVAELSKRLGQTLTGVDHDRAYAALQDASALIRTEAGKTWIDDHDELEEVPGIIESICIASAHRAFRNPDGTTQTSIGDVSISFRREGNASSVFLSKQERMAIRKAVGKSGSSSVTMVTPYIAETAHYFVEMEDGSEPMLFGPMPWQE
jgi:hypothetical protein